MPLLLGNYDFSKTETQSLNEAKRRINKIGVNQYRSVQNIKSTIRPTKTEMKSIYTKIITFLNTIYEVLRLIPNATPQALISIGDKIAGDYTTLVSEFSTKYNLSYTLVFNYLSPQEVENIKLKSDAIGETAGNILFGDYGQAIDNFVETLGNSIMQLQLDIQNYSPLSLNLNPSQTASQEQSQSQIDNLTGGYISTGGYIHKRFL